MSKPDGPRMTAAETMVQVLKFTLSNLRPPIPPPAAHDLEPALHPAQLGDLRQLAVVDPLHAVAESRLDVADVLDQAQEAADLDRCRLVAPPQRPVEGDVALDEGRSHGHRGPGRRQAGLVPGVADRALRGKALQGLDH